MITLGEVNERSGEDPEEEGKDFIERKHNYEININDQFGFRDSSELIINDWGHNNCESL